MPTFKEICEAAYKGETDLHLYDFDDVRLYHAMKVLYKEYKDGGINKDDAQAQTNLLEATYKDVKADRERWKADIIDFNKRIQTADKLHLELHKAQSIEEFAVKAAQIIEALTGDIKLQDTARKLGGNPFD